MTTISKLNSADSVSDGDLLPIYSTPNSDTRKASLSLLATYFQNKLAAGKAQTQYAAPSASGFSIIVQPAVNGADVHVLVTPTGVLSGGMITLPANNVAVDKQAVLITTTAALTGLTFAASGSSINGAPSMLGASCAIEFAYDKLTNAWYCISDADEDTIISVRQFISTAVDGVTSNQAGIEAAVSAAIASASDLYWPAGTYVSDANIPNFHSVRHFGPGIIKRGSALFYVQPHEGQTNTLNVAASGGADTNDGLSTSQAVATWQAAADILKNYGPLLDGVWVIAGNAATFAYPGTATTFSTPSKNRVVIRGPAVGGSPNVPTCIIDGGGNLGSYLHGFNCDGIGVRVEVRDIKFQNFSEASGNTRVGVVGANGADFYTNNVHSANCSWTGIYAKECEQARMTGGILDGSTTGAYGCISDSSHASFGYGATSLATGPLVKRCVSAGVYWSTGSQGHCDYVTFEDNGVAFLCAENSRSDTVGNSYKRNTVAKRAQTGGWFASGGAAENFNDGGADANGTNLEYRAYSGDIAENSGEGSGSWNRVAFDRTNRALSGTTPTTLTTPFTIKANRLKGVGKSCRVHSFGGFTQATAGSILTVAFGGMSLVIAVPAAAANAAFELDVELVELAGGYRAFGKLAQGLNAVRYAQASAGFVNTSDQAISISATLANAGDSMNIYRTDVYLMG